MKIAIIGSGPQAILAAKHFDQIGAEVVLFQRSPLGGNIRFLMEYFPHSKIPYENKLFKLEKFFETVLVPAVNELEQYNLTKQGDVLRVHKRFLHSGEVILNHTRMHDLFRVVYSLNPQENILKQLEENPEMFKQLGEEVIASLHKPVESFLDFDAVVEARGMGLPVHPMGAGGDFALNELNLIDGPLLFYQKDIFKKLDLNNKKSLVLVGESEFAKFALLHLKSWLLKSNEHELHWVTYKNEIQKTSNVWLDQEVENFLGEMNHEFESKKLEFESATRKWRDLEDYEKVKVPKPNEPKSRIQIYFGHDVTSVDFLLDRSGVFATLESPDYRAAQTQNKFQEETDHKMLTLAADAICIARGVKTAPLNPNMITEPGYYNLNGLSLNDMSQSLEMIENDLLKFFKKSE